MFSFNVNRTEDHLDVYMEGSLDAQSSPGLWDYLMDNLDGADGLTFHMDKVDYISSAGLRVVVLCIGKMKEIGTSLEIAGANDIVRDTFNVTGLLGQLKFV